MTDYFCISRYSRHKEFLAFIFLLFWSFILTAEFYIFGGASVMLSADNADQLVPSLLVREYSGQINPLWDRFAAAGVDDIAGADHALINIFLFNMLPAWAAHGLHIGAQAIVGMFSVYALLRRTLRISQLAAIFGAMVFGTALHPYLVTAVEAFTPALILALSVALDDKRKWYKWLGVAIAFLLVVWTGYFSRLIPYAGVFIVMWFLFLDTRKKIIDWAIIFVVCILTIAFKTKDIWTLMVVAPLSHAPLVRSFAPMSQHVEDFISSPFFLGTPSGSMAFGLFVLSAFFNHRNLLVHLGIALLLVFSGGAMTILLTAAQELIVPYLPFVAGYRFAYFSGILNLAYAAAAGYGIHILLDAYKNSFPRQNASAVPMKIGAAIMIGILGLPVAYELLKKKHASIYSWVTNGTPTRYFESPVLKNLAERISNQSFPERVEGYQIYPAYLNAYGLETAGSYNPIYYRNYYEYWGKLAFDWASQLPSTSFYRSKFSERRKTLGGDQIFRGDRLMMFPDEMRADTAIGDLYNLTLLSLANVGFIVSRDRLHGVGLRQISGPVEPWSALAHREQVRRNIWENFRGADSLFVYRNENVFPRFFFTNSLQIFESADVLLDTLASAKREDIMSTAFVERGAVPKNIQAGENFSPFTVELVSYVNDEIRLDVQGEGNGLLVITNTYSPFWKCRTGDTDLAVFPVYHAFWGMKVPEGTRNISCQYLPPYAWVWG